MFQQHKTEYLLVYNRSMDMPVINDTCTFMLQNDLSLVFEKKMPQEKGVCLQPPEGGPLVFLDPPMNGQVRIGKLVKYMYKILKYTTD